jgi:hypothetical protein
MFVLSRKDITRMASRTEEAVSCSLRLVLDGLAVGEVIADSEAFRNLLTGLEFLLPAVLGKVHGQWKYESLDGIYPAAARKTGPGEAEINGLCILISDQTLTPVHIRLQVSPLVDEITWLECSVGERGEGKGGMVRTPYTAMSGKQLTEVAERPKDIDWVYRVGFGQRKPSQQPQRRATEALD